MIERVNSCKCMLITKIIYMIPFIPMVQLELIHFDHYDFKIYIIQCD